MKKFAFALLFGVQLFRAALLDAASFLTFQVPGCGLTAAMAINNNDVIVGTCGSTAAAAKGFIRRANGRFTTFTVEGKPTSVTGINIHGTIVGTFVDTCPFPDPARTCFFGFIRSPSGAITKLSLFDVPSGINESGQVAFSNINSVESMAFLRDPDGTISEITPANFVQSVATGINNAGNVVGAAAISVSHFARAFIRASNGTVSILGPTNYQDTWVIGVNNLNAVIGIARTNNPDGTNTTVGFTQTATGAPVLFEVPFAWTDIRFIRPASGGINAKGAAVLQNVYISPTVVVTPIDLGPCLNVVAEAINDNGWVTGHCGEDAFLWRK
jgi:hypothetical protein